MTLSTDNKNITKIVRAILQSNGIDNLKAEIDIISAWHRYVTSREDGLTPAEVRAKIAVEYNGVGISEDGVKRNQIKDRMQTALGMEIDEGITDWFTVVTFCKTQEHYKGETIEKFMEWCKTDPYNSPKKHQIAQSPLLIKKMWASAFMTQQAEKSTLEDSGWK